MKKSVINKLTILLFVVGTLLTITMISCGHEHTYGEWCTVTEASCTEIGMQERICECGEKETQTIPTVAHQFDGWQTVIEPTCIEEGLQERICVCGEKETQTIPIVAHRFDGWQTVIEPTCIEEGLQERFCVCGEKETQAIAVVTTAHSFGEWKVVKEATCVEEGLHERTCSCGAKETHVIAIVAHEFGEWMIVTEPSCTEEGQQERICSCGKKETLSVATIPHQFGSWQTVIEPTCTEEGLHERTCACGAKESHVIAAVSAAHQFGAWQTVTEPTCMTEGLHERLCVCGEKEAHVIDIVPSAHQFDDWQTVTEPTCTEEGLEERSCRCGARDTRAIVKSAHQFGDWQTVANPSCTKEGVHERVCDCGEKETHAIAIVPTAHQFGDWQTVTDPTCSKEGVQRRTCACGESEIRLIDIVPTAHDYHALSEISPTLLEKGERIEECTYCQHERTTTLDVVDPESLDIPVIYISDYVEGEIPLVNLQKKNGEILVQYRYVSNDERIESFDAFCKIKIQGSSSASYAKKNFTVKFFEDADTEKKLKVDLGWGKQNKYCMKANYIDSSHSRNIIGAKLFAEVIQSRDNITAGLLEAPNYGVIDGYPTLVYVNGTFHGIYTMNIPKDDWQFGMDGGEEDREALLMANKWTDSVSLKEEIDETYVNSGWEVEYCSTEDDAWIRESFNKLITLLNCGDDTRIQAELANHLDIEAAIDNLLFTYYISAGDNVAKNILWATYDGEIWIPSMYDMDGTFGIFWNGTPIGMNDARPLYPFYSNKELASSNLLHKTLIRLYSDEVESRWIELRQEILTIENTTKLFDEFFAKIPEIAFTSETQRWLEIPYAEQNRKSMYEYTKQHIVKCDEFFLTFNTPTA